MYLNNPDHELALFHQKADRYQRSAREAGFHAANRAPGSYGRRLVALTIALIVSLSGVVAAQSAMAGTADTTGGCQSSNGTYQSGCRMLAGHADGWFRR
jgi:hypothetical protein